MSELPPNQMEPHLPGMGGVGVMDAVRMGWRLMMSDFWTLWLVAVVLGVLVSVAGCVPFGQLIAGPPLLAGFFYVLARRIDGGMAGPGEIFEGFRQRFAQSIVSVLPVLIAYAVLGVVYVIMYFALLLPVVVSAESRDGVDPGRFMAVFVPFIVVVNLIGLAMTVFQMFFMFAPLAVWEYPLSGWEAAKRSARLVREHFWSALGFMLLFWLISFGAYLVGILACVVGVFVTMPAAAVWAAGSIVYLYRGWSGQPLVRPPDEAPAGEQDQGGPVPPGDVEMSPT